MDINEFTQRSQQAILHARDAAVSRTNQYVQAEHLLDGLLAQTDGITYPIMSALGAHVSDIKGPLDAALSSFPQVTGGAEVAFAQDTLDVLDGATARRDTMKDAYTSVEHILIALAESPTEAGQILRDVGLSTDVILGALTEVRGAQRVTNQNPEDTFAPRLVVMMKMALRPSARLPRASVSRPASNSCRKRCCTSSCAFSISSSSTTL